MVAQKSAQSVLAYRAATEVAGGDWLAGYAGGDGLIDVNVGCATRTQVSCHVRVRVAHPTLVVIPAQAGIHFGSQFVAQYGFPPARE